MSAPPDYMNALLSGQDGIYSPTMGLAMGLLQAGGPSRMPVSLGQALGQGLQTGQQFQQQGLQNAMQQLMLGKTRAQINWMNSDPSQYGQPTNPYMQPNGYVAPSSPDSDVGVGLITQQPVQSKPNPQSRDMSINAPVQTGIVDPSQDPVYQYYSRGAQLGMPEAATLAGQRKDIIMGSPEFQASIERAKSFAVLQNVRQGGAVFDPTTWQVMFQNPHLPVGGILNPDRSVSMAPGAANTIIQSAGSEGIGKLFGEPATYVNPSGATLPTTEAGNIFGTTNPFNLTSSGPQQSGRVTALPPSVTSGMTETGKAATERANTSIEQQKSAQQTIGQLGQLQANLEALGTGPGKETQLEVKKALSSVGGFLGFPGLANADLTNAAAARKSIVNLTAPMVRAMGAREPFQMVNFIRDGMASISNPQDANQVVLGMLRGIAEYQNDTGRYAGNWLNDNNGAGFTPGKGAWDANWQKQADPGAYIFDNLPKFEQQSIINAAQKNPNLLAEIQRMAKSKKALTSQGFMLQENQ